MRPHAFLALFAAAALGFSLTPLALAKLWAMAFSPAKPGPVKNAVYECGLESQAPGWAQYQAGYFLYAIIFLIFDVETLFLLPFAAAFKGLSVEACVAALVFVLLLAEGLAWLWVRGFLSSSSGGAS